MVATSPRRFSRPWRSFSSLNVIAAKVEDYNEHRLHAGLRYVEPAEYFRGDPKRRMTERRAKLERGRLYRRQINLAQKDHGVRSMHKSELPTVGAAYG